jgi:hypothetical protein
VKHWLVILAVVLFVRATVSHADIVYHSANITIGDVMFPQSDEFFDLNLDGNSTVDFSFTSNLAGSAEIYRHSGNQYLIHPSPPPNIGGGVAALDSAYVIGSNSDDGSSEEWFGREGWATLILILDTGTTGEFYHNRAFVGVEFEAEDGVHYGWIDVEGATWSMENHLLTDSSLIIHGWAYESTPGVGIAAGAVPEPSSVALFTIGAIGVWILRKEKTANKSVHSIAGSACVE